MRVKVDHIGYAVRDIYEAITAFEKLGYVFNDIITDKTRYMMVTMGGLGCVKVELISPFLNNGNFTSPVDNYLKKIGNTPYHICYNVTDIMEVINSLRRQKFILVSPPTFYELLEGTAAFMFSRETGLIELVEHNGEENNNLI